MTDTSNYRYFALSCTLGKIIRRAIAERLYLVISESIPDSFFGFIRGRGTRDALGVLRRVMDQFMWSMDLNLIITSLDFYKAYDRVFQEAIACMLDSWNIQGPVRGLFNTFLGSTCKVVGTNGFPNSETFRQERGLPTGAPEAPVLLLA